MPTDKAYIETARLLHSREGELEVDSNAVVSRGDDPGAYVQAWVWVSNADVKACKVARKGVRRCDG